MCIHRKRKKKLIDIDLLYKNAKNDKKIEKNDNFSIKNEEKIEYNASIETLEEENLTLDLLPNDEPINPYLTEAKRVQDYHLEDGALSALKVWGLLLVILREDGFMTIHAAGGDIKEIVLKDFVLTVTVREDYMYNILSSEESLLVLNNEIKKINDKLSINILYKDSPKKSVKENEEQLKLLFGRDIDILS